jgi:DNA-binding transcriptional LysR family regulator
MVNMLALLYSFVRRSFDACVQVEYTSRADRWLARSICKLCARYCRMSLGSVGIMLSRAGKGMDNRAMDLDAIAVFVKVVQAGSFSQAARLLGMPNTTVSAKVARLERHLGVTLIQRTTRKLHITPAGQAYFERCLAGLTEIERAEAELQSGRTEPRGVLRITASAEVAHSLLPPIVTRYLESYPKVSVEVIVANRIVDLIGDGVDLAVRAAALKDSTLVARKWISFTGGLWASAAYLSKRGTPRTPTDLAGHSCLIHSSLGPRLLLSREGKPGLPMTLQGRILVDDMETLCAFVRHGNGIGGLPDYLPHDGDANASVHVLPQWSWTRGTLSFVYPSQPFVPAKVRTFIDLALDSIEQPAKGAQ